MQPFIRLLRLSCALFVGAASLAPTPAWAADEEETRIGGIDVVVWLPSAGARENLAVLMFSHALYMCPTQSRYLTGALADAGYLVIAPRHADSSCSFSMWPSLSRMSLKPSSMWTDSDFRDRADDIRTVVNALADDPRYQHVADLGRLALVGHSLGGYTVLGLGGAWPSWQLPGVRAIVALTPYSMPFQQSEGLRHIAAPIMYQAGTLDPIFTIPLEQFGYAQTPKPKYMVEIAWASHMAWTDAGGTSDRDAIIDYAIAFLDHYVKGAPESVALHDTLPGVSSFQRD